MADLLSVLVKTTLGHRCALSLPRGTLVSELKLRLQGELGVPADMQRLICGGKMPADDQSLESFVTAPNTMIYMLRVAFETGQVEASPELAPAAETHFPLIVPMRGSEERNKENDTLETVTTALEEWGKQVDNIWKCDERIEAKGVLRPLLTTLQQHIVQLTPLLGSAADFIDTERISSETRVKFSHTAAKALKSLAAASLSLSGILHPNTEQETPIPDPSIPLRPLQEVLSEVGSTSLEALVSSSGLDPSNAGVLLSTILELCSARDLAEITSGSTAPLSSLRSRLKPRLLAAMDGSDTSDSRRQLVAEARALASRAVSTLPDSIPGLGVAQSLVTCVERVAERVVCLVIDYPERDFGEVVKAAVLSCLSLWVTEAGKTAGGRPGSVIAALDSVVAAVCEQVDSAAMRSAVPYISQLVKEMVDVAERQTEVQRPTVSESELVASWTKTIERDVKQQLKSPPQRPLSRAYLHLSPYPPDPAAPTVKGVLESLLSSSLADARCSLSNTTVPSSVQQAFADALEGEVFALAGTNADFDQRRFAGVVELWRRKTVDRRSDA